MYCTAECFVPAPAFIYTHGPFLSPGHSARLLYPRLPSAALPLTSLQALKEGLIQVGLFIRTYYFLLLSQQFSQKKTHKTLRIKYSLFFPSAPSNLCEF